METDKIGVHGAHCCLRHGCSYGNNDCPVAWGTIGQKYRCELCDMDWESQGKPNCSAFDCKHPGYWKWQARINGATVALVGIEIFYFFCDGHDRWHRETKRGIFGRPVEGRVL